MTAAGNMLYDILNLCVCGGGGGGGGGIKIALTSKSSAERLNFIFPRGESVKFQNAIFCK